MEVILLQEQKLIEEVRSLFPEKAGDYSASVLVNGKNVMFRMGAYSFYKIGVKKCLIMLVVV